MDEAARRLHESLLDGFGPYVQRVGEAYGLGSDALEQATRVGRAVLEDRLTDLFTTPPDRQSTTPLEVFRASLAPLTQALLEAGVDPPVRDSQQVALAGDDPFDLWPASAAQVSDSAWEAAIGWGAAKATQIVLPLMVLVTRNLMDVGPFEAAAAQSGYRFRRLAPDDVADERPVVAFVDLELSAADEVVTALVATGCRVIGYGPHVDSFAMTRARSLGAAAAEPRSRVLRDPAAFLSPVV